jgi:hypothetical protein
MLVGVTTFAIVLSNMSEYFANMSASKLRFSCKMENLTEELKCGKQTHIPTNAHRTRAGVELDGRAREPAR